MSFLQKLIHSKKEAPPTEEEILQQIIAGQDYSVLPEFVYYPRAYEDGTIQAVENTVCPCCGKEVPCLYTGHFHFLDHGHGQEFKGSAHGVSPAGPPHGSFTGCSAKSKILPMCRRKRKLSFANVPPVSMDGRKNSGSLTAAI